jgi:photosystem II stability/assembly factor-like uncharacterized protein
MDSTIVYVGTVGQSIWKSSDGGLTFARASRGVHSECDVRALSIDPRHPQVLLLGTETGLFRSDDGADNWRHVPSPMDGMQIWSLARDPAQPDTIYAGTCPADIFRSRDGGETWTLLDSHCPRECVGGAPLTPRVTCILVDRDGTVFAGVEIAGVRRSRDSGENWDVLTSGLSSQDIHGLAAVWNGRRTLIATTNNDVNRSDDDGDNWSPLAVRRALPWSYSRACALSPADENCVWVGAGNGPPGNQGGLYATQDLGTSWKRLGLPQITNSTVWNFAFHPSDPRRAYVSSVSGQLYRTLDGSASWSKLPMEFGEVRAIAWLPGA